jgi:hypothetical protein
VSLVSEALKKAERDAAAREARERGLPVPLETPMQPYRARRGQRGGRGAGPWLALLAGGAAAVAVAVLLARPALERKDSDKGPTVKTPAISPAASPPTTPAPAHTQAAATADAAPTAPTEPTPARPAAPGPSEREPPAARPRTLPSPETVPEAPPKPPSAREPRAPSPAPGRSKSGEFVRRIDFPDGSKLELGGIAYSETAPFAYLNGKLLKAGEGTAGYTLVRIERDRVVVRGAAGDLTILLKAR